MSVDCSFPVVGVGASAGGYEAFVHLLEALPTTLGAAIVFVQHLDPTHESMLVALLSRVTGIPVEEATDGTTVEPGRIYVAPPGATVVINNGTLGVGPSQTPRHLRMPVDAFLRSLAEDRGNAAIGVILSGTGTDGTLGLWQIKEEGGICLVQDPNTAKFGGMPQSAIAETAVDFTLPPEGIARELVRLANHPYVRPAAAPEDEVSAHRGDKASLGRILGLLKSASGVDFASYKQNTIIRRTLRRMTLLDKDDLAEYASYCEEHQEELVALYHDLLIKVTNFFREPESFTVLKQKVLPALFEGRPSDRPFRIWVPACSSGEEAYSIAIVLFEFLAERKLPTPVIQIFATDVDESILVKARTGAYVDNIAADISAERLRQFFTHADHKYTISKQIRDVCTFARHNLLTDPPFSNLDLISCHNLFIYFDLPAQRRVIPSLHYALRPNGFLTLSSAESITADELFALVDSKFKVYQRRGGAIRTPTHAQPDLARTAPSLPAKNNQPRATPEQTLGGYRGAVDLDREGDRTLLEYYRPVGVLVNESLDILQYRGDTSRYLAPAPGRASLNLLSMARAGLLGDLRAAVEEAKATQQAATREGVPVTFDGTFLEVTIRVLPARPTQSSARHHMVLFEEPQANAPSVKRKRLTRASANLMKEDQALRQLRGELESTKAYLQTVVDDRDTAIEGLRSSNEEVLSANEELQSTNEELETAKEELQSSNEELITSNEEARRQNHQLSRVNDDLKNLFDSSHLPIVLLGDDLRIRQFSKVARRVLNVIPTDVGRPFTDLRLNIRVPDLEALLRRVVAGGQPVEREVQDVEGGWYLLRITPYMTSDQQLNGAVLILIDIGALKNVDRLKSLLNERAVAEAKAQAARLYAESIVETVRHPLLVLDSELRVQSANRDFFETFRVSPDETLNSRVYDTGGGQWGVPELQKLLEEVLPGNNVVENVELEQDFPRVGRRTILINARVIEQAGKGSEPTNHILLAVEDITERKQIETDLREEGHRKNAFLAMLSHELRNPLAPIQAAVDMLRHPQDDAANGEVFQLLERQVGMLTQLVNELLEVSRVTTGKVHLKLADCDVPALVQHAVDTTRPGLAARGHALSLSMPDSPVRVQADAMRMEQVLVNLLNNAVKYTPEGGHIWLTVAQESEDVVIRVKDSGMGIEPDLLPHLFELFSQGVRTLDRADSGLGIGLALAKNVVEMHGGTVTAASEGLGKGCEFIVRLPAMKSSPPEPAPGAVAGGSSSSLDAIQPIQVLLVDDNVDMTNIFAMFLRKLGHEVRTAHEGPSAIEAAIEFQPQVVVLDIGLPDMDGYQVARRMRQEPALQGVVLVAMTGYGTESDRERSRAAGFDHHLVKPADQHEVRRIFAEAAKVTSGVS